MIVVVTAEDSDTTIHNMSQEEWTKLVDSMWKGVRYWEWTDFHLLLMFTQVSVGEELPSGRLIQVSEIRDDEDEIGFWIEGEGGSQRRVIARHYDEILG